MLTGTLESQAAMLLHVYTVYVTGFEKTRLPRTIIYKYLEIPILII